MLRHCCLSVHAWLELAAREMELQVVSRWRCSVAAWGQPLLLRRRLCQAAGTAMEPSCRWRCYAAACGKQLAEPCAWRCRSTSDVWRPVHIGRFPTTWSFLEPCMTKSRDTVWEWFAAGQGSHRGAARARAPLALLSGLDCVCVSQRRQGMSTGLDCVTTESLCQSHGIILQQI